MEIQRKKLHNDITPLDTVLKQLDNLPSCHLSNQQNESVQVLLHTFRRRLDALEADDIFNDDDDDDDFDIDVDQLIGDLDLDKYSDASVEYEKVVSEFVDTDDNCKYDSQQQQQQQQQQEIVFVDEKAHSRLQKGSLENYNGFDIKKFQELKMTGKSKSQEPIVLYRREDGILAKKLAKQTIAQTASASISTKASIKAKEKAKRANTGCLKAKSMASSIKKSNIKPEQTKVKQEIKKSSVECVQHDLQNISSIVECKPTSDVTIIQSNREKLVVNNELKNIEPKTNSASADLCFQTHSAAFQLDNVDKVIELHHTLKEAISTAYTTSKEILQHLENGSKSNLKAPADGQDSISESINEVTFELRKDHSELLNGKENNVTTQEIQVPLIISPKRESPKLTESIHEKQTTELNESEHERKDLEIIHSSDEQSNQEQVKTNASCQTEKTNNTEFKSQETESSYDIFSNEEYEEKNFSSKKNKIIMPLRIEAIEEKEEEIISPLNFSEIIDDSKQTKRSTKATTEKRRRHSSEDFTCIYLFEEPRSKVDKRKLERTKNAIEKKSPLKIFKDLIKRKVSKNKRDLSNGKTVPNKESKTLKSSNITREEKERILAYLKEKNARKRETTL